MNNPMLVAEKVSKRYYEGRSNEVRALEEVSLAIGANEFAVIYGPSGSGKTTLLGLLGTIDRPTTGKIFLRGEDISGFSDLELSRIRRETIGFVFQSFNLLAHLPAWENVAYPLVPMGIRSRERRERAAALLERFGLSDRLNHSPEELSGGEQQRVAIARALVNDPQTLIADEPTSNIDADSAARLMEILAALKEEGKTIIVSSHDPVFRRHCDALFMLRRGGLEGTERPNQRHGGVS